MTDFKLSQELLPYHEGGVQALCTLPDGAIVTGGDDALIKIWRRSEENKPFEQVGICGEHQRALRALTVMPPSEDLPEGGFISGALDARIHIYDNSGVYQGCLDGHTGGVISFDWTSTGQLISGSWDGTARVWDVANKKCIHVLGGQENGVCVVGLPSGDIFTGSTGRKDERDRHVDYRIRRWREGKEIGRIEDHQQAVRWLAKTPEGGFVSASNDGTIIVRNAEGAPLSTFVNPILPEGKPVSAFKALVLPSGDIWTMNEDQIIRVYRTGALAQTIPMPGVAWYAAPLSNGDVAVVCNQAGRSLLGHAYVFSVDPARTGDAALEAQFEEDMKAAATTGQSDGGTGGGESEQVPIAGPYEQRQSLPGTKEGQISIFLRADGVQMVCAWSSSSGSWTDIGVRQEGPGAGGAGPSAALESVAAPSAGGSSTPLQPGEIRRSVTMETPTGLRTLNLQFHASEDPVDVTHRFMQQGGITSMDHFEQIRDFVLNERRNAGYSDEFTSAPAAAAAPQYKHFPLAAPIKFAKVDLDRPLAKLDEFNNALTAAGADVALNAEDKHNLKALVAVLNETSRYHISSVSRDIVSMFRKLLQWPLDQRFPGLDVLRTAMLHPVAAGHLAGLGEAMITAILESVSSDASPTPAKVMGLRCIVNAFRHTELEALCIPQLTNVFEPLGPLITSPTKLVSSTAAAALLNAARAIPNEADTPAAEELATQVFTVVEECMHNEGVCGEAVLVIRLTLAAAHAALRSPSSRAIATDLEIGASLAHAASRLSDGEAAEVVHEFERLLAATD